MTAPAPELLPCPFCGSTNLKSGGDDKFVGTRCVDCEASGPNHYGKTDWNTRQAASVGAEVARSEVLIEELTAVQIAFGQATTQTEIDPERRWQAIKLVTEFLGKLRLSHGAAQKSEVRSREAIARIVDHDAWELYDNANTLTKMQKPISLWRIEPSLAKADAILTLSAAQASTDHDEYFGAHEVYCNASRKLPVGCDGCSCRAGREIKQLRTNVEYWRLAAERRDARKELTWLDIPEARTLDAPDTSALPSAECK